MSRNKSLSGEQIELIVENLTSKLGLKDIINIISSLAYDSGLPILMAHLQDNDTGEVSTPIIAGPKGKPGYDMRFTSHGFPQENVNAFITTLTNADVDVLKARSLDAPTEKIDLKDVTPAKRGGDTPTYLKIDVPDECAYDTAHDFADDLYCAGIINYNPDKGLESLGHPAKVSEEERAKALSSLKTFSAICGEKKTREIIEATVIALCTDIGSQMHSRMRSRGL